MTDAGPGVGAGDFVEVAARFLTTVTYVGCAPRWRGPPLAGRLRCRSARAVNRLFLRAVLAFLALPGMVAFVDPAAPHHAGHPPAMGQRGLVPLVLGPIVLAPDRP